MVTTTHYIHCAGSSSGSHELPTAAAAAEGEHCILYTGLARSTSAGTLCTIMLSFVDSLWIVNSANSVYTSSHI